MRKFVAFVIVFIFVISGCSSEKPTGLQTFQERQQTSFNEWQIPLFFIPKELVVIGLGDSLTEGVGDERKRSGYFGRVSTAFADLKGVKNVHTENLAKRGRRSDQLIEQFSKKDIQREVEKADVILLTIGGNDVMKVVRANLFNLQLEPFYEELERFSKRLDEVFSLIRLYNDNAVIVIGGLYNPFTLVTDQAHEFETIVNDWNESIESKTKIDSKSCFVPVKDLFVTNENMVYHTDFFHPNAVGYEAMAKRYLETINNCNLEELPVDKLKLQE